MEPKYIFENGVMSINPKYQPLDTMPEPLYATPPEQSHIKKLFKKIENPQTTSTLILQKLWL